MREGTAQLIVSPHARDSATPGTAARAGEGSEFAGAGEEGVFLPREQL